MNKTISKAEARNYSALQLAFIGDAVYNLVMRLHSLQEGKGLRAMHMRTTGRVNAVAQSKALKTLEGLLDEEELDIVRRGRNAHPRHQAPRSATTAQYCASTGFEALIGYHYLTGQTDRLRELFTYLQTHTGE
ncbi:MAG: ribonuclease III domain-containing protein [Christensenellales bacterium]|jgi:ribonuclease-3 family protein|nr:ribonuclease III [Clostridiales bacterium]